MTTIDMAAPWVSVASCRHGWMAFNRNDTVVGRSLATYGQWSEGELRLLLPLLRPDDVVIDGGANVGTHTIPMARAVGPRGRVVAYEPQRLVYQLLCANLVLNGLESVRTQRAALGSRLATVSFPTIDPRAAGNFGGIGLLQGQRGERVQMTTIDATPLQRCRLIKLDLEGMELDAIDGAQETLTGHRPAIYVENDRRDRSPVLIHRLRQLGYRLWWHMVPLYERDNYRNDPVDRFPGLASLNLLGLPEGADSRSPLIEVTSPEDWAYDPGHPAQHLAASGASP